MRASILRLFAVSGGLTATALNVPQNSLLPKKFSNKFLGTTAAIIFPVLSISAAPLLAAAATEEWQLLNGNVILPDPIELTIIEKKEGGSRTVKQKLSNPTLIGAGGGGSVFSFANDLSVILKVSWKDSTQSVQRECQTLQLLESRHVKHTERCLGEFPYTDDQHNRVMIALEPYVPDAVASVSQLDSASKQEHAVQQIAVTLVQMLAANVVTIDVQPLISTLTGDVLFIDLTEAVVLENEKPAPPGSLVNNREILMASFTTEIMALIPESLVHVASKAIAQEMQTESTTLSDEAKSVLGSFLED